jgi:hypothetical protein
MVLKATKSGCKLLHIINYAHLGWDGLEGFFAAVGYRGCKCARQRRDGRIEPDLG